MRSTGAVKWKYRSPRPMVAAVTTTAGNLVLTGELTGDFVAFDARSGDVLYRFNTGGPIGGGVVTYAAGGRQYIAVASGSPSNFWTERNPGAPTIVVFALPANRGDHEDTARRHEVRTKKTDHWPATYLDRPQRHRARPPLRRRAASGARSKRSRDEPRSDVMVVPRTASRRRAVRSRRGQRDGDL